MNLPQSAVDRLTEALAAAELGDARRCARAQRVVAQLAKAPGASLPMAMGSDAELQGCYRLLNNEEVSFEKLMAASAQATRKRAEQAGSVLVVHDTTTCSFPQLAPEEIGYLPTGKAGFFLHPALVLDANEWRRPLGVIHAECLVREKRSKRRGKAKASGVETAKWEGRESQRWWRGMKASGAALAGCKKVIHVADREGDSYELMANLLEAKQRFVIRVKVAARRGRTPDNTETAWSTVKEVAASCEGLLEREVPLSRRPTKSAPGMSRAHAPRKGRLARLHFAATRVEIPRPQYLKDPVPEQLAINLVRVWEPAPEPGEPAVEWLLYSTEPIETAADVAAIVDIYRSRWTIEEFNAALKTGCAYEERELQSSQGLLAMLALSLPIACEVLALRSRARTAPNAPAREVLNPVQLQILRTFGSRPISSRPTVQDALLAVAALGGHLKRNGPPGWLVLQRGMTQLLIYEAGWRAGRQAMELKQEK